MATWGEFESDAPDLAAFGTARLSASPAYLATVRDACAPRVHPVTPVIGGGGLFVFMEPTSPKGHDLRKRAWYALHSGVPDNGHEGEFFVRGRAMLVDDPEIRAVAVASATYEIADRYILFVLDIDEARCNGFGDVQLPAVNRWPTPR